MVKQDLSYEGERLMLCTGAQKKRNVKCAVVLEYTRLYKSIIAGDRL